ncbi:MAG TPA: hypothetical protein H9867_08380 [Candidatus Corynebacterium gallistercoris]|uniref:Secreted protein n=1 Tax=Candidatus Corynebacterium gallistercoris TaxID=2838530 RepID=A0A9D1S1D5_9CORY|nr:hypothetical protein [Candidatus Corynebacterium gallistercoris]
MKKLLHSPSIILVALCFPFTISVASATTTEPRSSSGIVSPGLTHLPPENTSLNTAATQDQTTNTSRQILKANAALQELLGSYSIDPEGDLEQLATSLTVEQAKEFNRTTQGKRFIVTPGEHIEFQLVEDNGIRKRSSGNKCWKGYVGIAAYTTVSGFYCGLTGPAAPLCGIGAAIGGDNVDWHKNC